METQSTVTDSAFSQVEQALLEPVPPQREVTPAEAPVEPPVANERDEESGARCRTPIGSTGGSGVYMSRVTPPKRLAPHSARPRLFTSARLDSLLART